MNELRGRRWSDRCLIGLTLAVALLALPVASAYAVTTFGSDLSVDPNGAIDGPGCSIGGCTMVQGSPQTGGRNAAPISGVVVL